MGSKVAGIVKGPAIAVWVIGALAGLAVWGVGAPAGNSNAGFISMLVIWLSAFLAGVFYYAFGELLENVAEIRSNTARQLEVAARQAEAMSRQFATVDGPRFGGEPARRTSPPTAATHTPTPEPARPSAITVTTADLRTTDSGTRLLTCPSCGLEQPATRKRCWRCAAEFTLGAHSEQANP